MTFCKVMGVVHVHSAPSLLSQVKTHRTKPKSRKGTQETGVQKDRPSKATKCMVGNRHSKENPPSTQLTDPTGQVPSVYIRPHG